MSGNGMLDGLLRSMFGMLKIDPVEGQKMLLETVASIQNVDNSLKALNARLDRIEQTLNIHQPIIEIPKSIDASKIVTFRPERESGT